MLFVFETESGEVYLFSLTISTGEKIYTSLTCLSLEEASTLSFTATNIHCYVTHDSFTAQP